MQHLQAAIESIQTENGYANTMHLVQRLQQDGQAPVHGNGVHVIDGDDFVEGVIMAGDHDLVSRRRHVDLIIVAQQDDALSASELMNSLEADVRRAVNADWTRGGLAVNTEETQANETDIEIGMPELRRVLGYEIRYRTRRTDPTIAG
ncbi:MAG: hypothetical protein OEY77_00265 [Nitrospira sp.]|nr:hypothetical protein [Nitrospira sp.]